MNPYFEFTLTRRRWALPSRRWVATLRRGPHSTTLTGPDHANLLPRVADVTIAWFGAPEAARLWGWLLEYAEQHFAPTAEPGDRLGLEVQG